MSSSLYKLYEQCPNENETYQLAANVMSFKSIAQLIGNHLLYFGQSVVTVLWSSIASY